MCLTYWLSVSTFFYEDHELFVALSFLYMYVESFCQPHDRPKHMSLFFSNFVALFTFFSPILHAKKKRRRINNEIYANVMKKLFHSFLPKPYK